MDKVAVENRLLRGLSDSVRSLVVQACTPVTFEAGDVLTEIGSVADIYFVEAGVLSVVAAGGDLPEVEISPLGREGLSGSWVALGREAAPFRITGRVRGSALRMSRDVFQRACAEHRALADAVRSYAQDFTGMVAEACRAIEALSVEARLARWLLMAHDRLDAGEFAITHDTLSRILSVRRPSVTVALHVLEGEHIIESTRGWVRIRDRQKLVAVARGTSCLPPRKPWARPHDDRRLLQVSTQVA